VNAWFPQFPCSRDYPDGFSSRMIDELADLTGTRLPYLMALCSTLWTLQGMFLSYWRVGDLFFWFWCELLLGGLSCIALVYRWERLSPQGSAQFAFKEALLTAVALIIVGFFATLFTLLAWIGDYKEFSVLPSYIDRHALSLVLLALGFIATHFLVAHRKNFPVTPKNNLVKPLMSKMWPVLGLYFVMIEQYHLTGSTTLDLTSGYLKMMAGALLGFKLTIEMRHVLRKPKIEMSAL